MKNTLQIKVDKAEMLIQITKLKVYLNQVSLLIQEIDYLVNELEKAIIADECEECNIVDFNDILINHNASSGIKSAIVVDPNGVARLVPNSITNKQEEENSSNMLQLIMDLLIN
ncbi:hypothetical protein HB911_15570 [Listeria booriae]|uniref:hypothetical protein n=1 Tax=Listeria booriae TaxID=1552123 RepID=UPI0016290B0C|nr:hypothetical protein [Listeria booriae]MBC1560132.1 hypothetical protein [Listeria booriae]